MAEKLDSLLQEVVADGDMTIDKVLGMAFIVQDKEGAAASILECSTWLWLNPVFS